MSVDFAKIVHAADIRVRDLARDAHFVVKAGQHAGIARHGFGQELERHRLIESKVVGAIDFAHAAFAEQSDDLIAPSHHHARGEAALAPGDSCRNGRGPRCP
jgi:hypothetical protein